MNTKRFEHLLTLAGRACPGCNYRGTNLAEIIVYGYSHELEQDLSQLFGLPLHLISESWYLLIDQYCRHYERFLAQWLFLLAQCSLPAGDHNTADKLIPKVSNHPLADQVYEQWRRWRCLRLYQIKRYYLYFENQVKASAFVTTQSKDQGCSDTALRQ